MRIALLGGPDTGKSSYLVALFGALENRSADPLELVALKDEVGFLNRGLEALTRQERVKRTDMDSRSHVAIAVRCPSGDVDLEIPDRSGELVKRMGDDRVWDEELLSSVDELEGALLFLHVLRFDPGRSAEELERLLNTDGDRAESASEGASSRDDDPIPWAPNLMPADVRAVDLLQAILEKRSTALPLAVVISAWDRVQPPNVKPRTWLQHRAPLFDQFLESNQGRLRHALYGVSAQGFDFRVDDAAAERGRPMDPWQRMRVLDSDGNLVSFGAPILWLIEEANQADA